MKTVTIYTDGACSGNPGPGGPKVGTVTLSPRGDWRMPSDAVARLWLDEVELLEETGTGMVRG